MSINWDSSRMASMASAIHRRSTPVFLRSIWIYCTSAAHHSGRLPTQRQFTTIETSFPLSLSLSLSLSLCVCVCVSVCLFVLQVAIGFWALESILTIRWFVSLWIFFSHFLPRSDTVSDWLDLQLMNSRVSVELIGFAESRRGYWHEIFVLRIQFEIFPLAPKNVWIKEYQNIRKEWRQSLPLTN